MSSSNQSCCALSASSQQKQLLCHRLPNPIPFPSLLHSIPFRMHSATHAKAERLLGTHSHIHNLGLDSSLEPHAVSNDMVGEIAISPTPLIWASNLTVTSQQMGANVTVNCVHPGIVRTRLTREREGLLTDLVFFLASKLLKTIPQAAATTCYVATHPRLFNVSNKYFADCNEISTSKLGSNSTEAARLWAASLKYDCFRC
ncbi:hypothetical protein JHK86_035266 [Glycine max]|nr:hypothetical protein JHK86_035266 [Glycine max]